MSSSDIPQAAFPQRPSSQSQKSTLPGELQVSSALEQLSLALEPGWSRSISERTASVHDALVVPGVRQSQSRLPSSWQGLEQPAARAARAMAATTRIRIEGAGEWPAPPPPSRTPGRGRLGGNAVRGSSVWYVRAMLALALVLAVTASAPAEPAAQRPAAADAQTLVRKVQAFYEKTHDLTAKFRQTYTYAGFGRRQVSSGVLLVKKPGMMRWDYQKPTPKTVVVKGTRLVQYEPDANQAYVDDHFDSSGMSAALTFLLGKGDLEKEFEVSSGEGGALLLRPRVADPRVDEIILAADGQGQIVSTRVLDGAGNVNEIQLEDVRRNTGIADSAFDLKLPEGVVRMAPPVK